MIAYRVKRLFPCSTLLGLVDQEGKPIDRFVTSGEIVFSAVPVTDPKLSSVLEEYEPPEGSPGFREPANPASEDVDANPAVSHEQNASGAVLATPRAKRKK